MPRLKRDDELETVDDSVKNAPKDANVSNEPDNVVAEPVVGPGAAAAPVGPRTVLKETPGLPEEKEVSVEDAKLEDVQADHDKIAAELAEHQAVLTDPNKQDVVHAAQREKAYAHVNRLQLELRRLAGRVDAVRNRDAGSPDRAKELYEDRLAAEEELHKSDRYTPR